MCYIYKMIANNNASLDFPVFFLAFGFCDNDNNDVSFQNSSKWKKKNTFIYFSQLWIMCCFTMNFQNLHNRRDRTFGSIYAIILKKKPTTRERKKSAAQNTIIYLCECAHSVKKNEVVAVRHSIGRSKTIRHVLAWFAWLNTDLGEMIKGEGKNHHHQSQQQQYQITTRKTRQYNTTKIEHRSSSVDLWIRLFMSLCSFSMF